VLICFHGRHCYYALGPTTLAARFCIASGLATRRAVPFGNAESLASNRRYSVSMDPRKEIILKLIVDEYIRTAEPVGSKLLVQKYGLGVSPATIRNDMAVLEAEGFIKQPHTSAGRIPTEQAYVFYLQHFVEAGRNRLRGAPIRKSFPFSQDREEVVKFMARRLVELSGETAIVAMGPKWSYYTGVSNLFMKPDFHDLALMQSISELVDQFDSVMANMFGRVSDDTVVMLGSQNPFGEQMSTIMVKYALPGSGEGLIGLIGPMRMNYARNMDLLERAKHILDEEFSR